MDMSKAISFNLKDDFVIQVGEKNTEIKIPRLKYKNAGTVLRIIGEVIADDNAKAIQSIGEAARANAASNKKGYDEYAAFIKKVQPALLESKSVTIIGNVLKIVSEDAITDEHLNEMQYEETARLAAYLIEKNFESLKNFTASLQAISTSAK
jgi:hypothetical protein